jgi:hypothetical protein
MNGALVIIKPDGTRSTFRCNGPNEPAFWRLEQLVGGRVDMIPVSYQGEQRFAYVNADGFAWRLPRNSHVTAMARGGYCVLGTAAVWCPDVDDDGTQKRPER